MPSGIRISSNNLSGETTNVTFLPYTGGTINLGEKTLPFEYNSEYPYGTYELYFELYNKTYELNALFPSPTITPTLTRTPSITPSITRTPSITPSITPTQTIPSQEDLDFNGWINDGSINIVYRTSINSPESYDIQISFVHELLVDGGGDSFFIKGFMQINEGETESFAKFASSEAWADYSKLSGV